MASQASPHGRWVAVAIGLALALLLGAWLAPAAAGEDEGQTLTMRVREHANRLGSCRRTRDVHGLHEEIWRAPVLYREVEEADGCAGLRARLVRGIGTLCRHGDARIRLSAVEALGAMKSEAGARYLKPLLKPGREKPADPLTMAAIESAGDVRHESLVAPLLKIARRCPCPLATRRAVESLGGYRSIEKKREAILLELLEVAVIERPEPVPEGVAVQSDGRGDLGRWKALSTSVPEALNRLTGRDVDTLDAWIALVDENREHLGSLFETDKVGA